jgi:uncharacterized membrane protein YdjX (TVP38/TMEM64 family)
LLDGQESTRGNAAAEAKKRNLIKLIGIILVVAALVVLTRATGLAQYIGLGDLREWVEGFGIIAPLVFMAIFVVAAVAFLPGSPLGLLAGLVFGPIWGTVWALTGATLGATLAFLAGRYAFRDMVESWVENSAQVRRLDEGVEKHGWRMLVITRLVPVFPFNLQNYAYGLTKIKLGTYVLVTATCMLPGTIAYTFAGGSLSSGRLDTSMFVYLGIAAVFFVLLTLIPGWLKKRSAQKGEELF